MRGEPNDANASALVCSGCLIHNVGIGYLEPRRVEIVRMRLHRKRRREGTHYVRIPLESFEIEGLIRLKVLPKAHREDADALQAAVLTLVYQALDGAG